MSETHCVWMILAILNRFKVESEFDSLTDSEEEEENEESGDSGRSNVGVNGSEDDEQKVWFLL